MTDACVLLFLLLLIHPQDKPHHTSPLASVIRIVDDPGLMHLMLYSNPDSNTRPIR